MQNFIFILQFVFESPESGEGALIPRPVNALCMVCLQSVLYAA